LKTGAAAGVSPAARVRPVAAATDRFHATAPALASPAGERASPAAHRATGRGRDGRKSSAALPMAPAFRF